MTCLLTVQHDLKFVSFADHDSVSLHPNLSYMNIKQACPKGYYQQRQHFENCEKNESDDVRVANNPCYEETPATSSLAIATDMKLY